jgi:exodeoxyribonuclease VII large subunit
MVTPPSTGARDREVLTPSRLNQRARELIEGHFGLIWVEGELSNLSRPASGHLYFTLKDAGAQVRCAMFKPRSTYLRFRPRDGQAVLARGRLSLYEARGDFQLVVEHLEESGEGALRRAFEQLKARLHVEGLFDPARKRPLPRLVRRLAVLSSPSGAAVHDVLAVLGRRFPLLPVDLVPVPVQGAEAAARILAALNATANARRHDVILLTRGGGSLEDLWCFNDEALARAIAASPVPVVSAIGHEIDFTIADFAADLRAPTPSAAAELLVPDCNELLARIERCSDRLEAGITRIMRARSQRLDLSGTRLQAGRPAARLAIGRTRLEPVEARLHRLAQSLIAARRLRLEAASDRLVLATPATRIVLRRERIERARVALEHALTLALAHARQRLTLCGRALTGVDPDATVRRGYAIVRRADTRELIRSVMALRPGATLEIALADGRVQAIVTGTEIDPKAGPKPPRLRG